MTYKDFYQSMVNGKKISVVRITATHCQVLIDDQPVLVLEYGREDSIILSYLRNGRA